MILRRGRLSRSKGRRVMRSGDDEGTGGLSCDDGR